MSNVRWEDLKARKYAVCCTVCPTDSPRSLVLCRLMTLSTCRSIHVYESSVAPLTRYLLLWSLANSTPLSCKVSFQTQHFVAPLIRHISPRSPVICRPAHPSYVGPLSRHMSPRSPVICRPALPSYVAPLTRHMSPRRSSCLRSPRTSAPWELKPSKTPSRSVGSATGGEQWGGSLRCPSRTDCNSCWENELVPFFLLLVMYIFISIQYI